MNSIYALVDPRDKALRYVGKSRNPQIRLQSHRNSKANTQCSRWIQKLKQHGLAPEMVIIEDGLSEEEWPEREKHWIAHYRDSGAKLTNIADGGVGIPISKEREDLPYGYTLGYKVPALRKNEMCIYYPEYGVYRFFMLTDEQAARVRRNEASRPSKRLPAPEKEETP